MKNLLFLLLFLCFTPFAATHYIRDGGTASTAGTGSCTGWATANVCDQLPTTLIRGDIYCIADGTYTTPTLNTANSGTLVITIRKAVHGDGGCANGSNWLSTYGDGQAVWSGGFNLGSDYWVIDGATRNESNWIDGSSYGFRASEFVASTSQFPGVCASHLTVQYIDIGGPEVGNVNQSGYGPAFYIGGFDEYCTNWTLSRNYIHNTRTTFHLNGTTGGTIEYSYIRYGWSKEAVRGQIFMSNWTIRHNIWRDACQGNLAFDPTGGACTATIGLFDGYENSAGYSGTKIYGNVFWSTTAASQQDAILAIGGSIDNVTGAEVYNNTIAGFEQGQRTVLVRSTTGSCRNNLSYDNGVAISYSCTNQSNNTNVTTDPFVSYSTGDFRLSSATVNGTSLASPYNVDLVGTTRGVDGIWDLGAFEYSGGGGSTPNAPQNFRLLDIGSLLLGLGLLSSLLWRNKHGDNSNGPKGRFNWGLSRMGNKEIYRMAEQ